VAREVKDDPLGGPRAAVQPEGVGDGSSSLGKARREASTAAAAAVGTVPGAVPAAFWLRLVMQAQLYTSLLAAGENLRSGSMRSVRCHAALTAESPTMAPVRLSAGVSA